MIRRTFLDITNDYLDGKITLKEFFEQIEEYENAITGAEIAKQKKVLSTLLCYGEKCNYWKDGKCHAFNPITANGKCITGKYYPTEIDKNDNTL